ncbi:MAG: glycosyl transferase [Candidatus Woesearchaeota archaeon]|nr:MAG: glycosyl transferase [Candidatus Woesearchaeota archaeon]
MKPKLLYIIPQNPYPPIDGGKIGLYYPNIYLKEYFDLFCYFRDDNPEKAKATVGHFESEGIKANYYLKDIKDTPLMLLKNFLEESPFKWKKYFDKKALLNMIHLIEKENINFILVSSPHMMDYAIKIKHFIPSIKIILREHNIESELVKQFMFLIKNPFFKLIAKWQHDKSIKREIYYWSLIDKVCFISDSDYKKALELAPHLKAKYELVYDGFNISEKIDSSNLDIDKEPFTFIFSGSLRTLQNRYNLNWYIENIWKKFIISTYGNKYKLYITGNSVEDLKKYFIIPYEKLKSYNIINLGFVDNINEIIKTKEYFLSPTIIGSGIRLKVLHAMSLGMVTFLTDIDYKMVEYFKDMENVVLFRNYDEFLEKVIKLENSKVLKDNISVNAYNLIKDKLNWNRYAEKMSLIIKD